MSKQKIVAMILAGGQGSRLKDLTTKNAKPAVHFGGKYRVIDFAISNCANSAITNVGILTQYQPMALNAHIGIGVPWDLDRRIGGVKMLPPYVSTEGGRWFKGTANAVYENIDYIDIIDPEYVLILSGDHIYKMDYNLMLKKHEENNADLTISAIEVPIEEANRFGILNTDKDNFIYEFEEKPEKPKSNKASMGIYIFKWKILREYLINDNDYFDTTHDFGKDIIPRMLSDDLKLQAYVFEGYWKDVGTIDSYWQAHMDLLNPFNELDLYNNDWKIYTRNYDMPPHYASKNSNIENSLVNEGCFIEGEVKNSVLSTGVIVEEGAKVIDSVILPEVVIKKGAYINRAIIMSGYTVEKEEVIDSKEGNITLVATKDIGILG